MCSHYDTVLQAPLLKLHFAVQPSQLPAKQHIWPGYEAGFIRKHPLAHVGDEAVPSHEYALGRFGLIPHWAKDEQFGKKTYNARSETVDSKPSYRDAWRQAQTCIVPAHTLYEPDWRTGKAITRGIGLASGVPMGIAGLWTSWKSPQGHWIDSFTMLTVNADAHPFMQQYHRPSDEKRMVVILPPQQYDTWLNTDMHTAKDFLQCYPAHLMMQLPQASEHQTRTVQLF